MTYLGEDSFFLAEETGKYLKDKDKEIEILDLGAGSGIISETCLNLGFKNLIAADIDIKSIRFLEKKFKSKIKIVKSDLFSKLRGKFDLIIFNPPYLPENKYDKNSDTTGGKKGDETILKFLEQAKNHLKENGKILLLLSSLTPRARINNTGWKIKKLANKNLFFEKLEILELSFN